VASLPQVLEGGGGRVGETGSVRIEGSLLGDDAGVVGAGVQAFRRT